MLPHFGPYVEIEGPSQEAVQQVQGRLDLGGLAQEKKSYSHMVSELLVSRGGRELRFSG